MSDLFLHMYDNGLIPMLEPSTIEKIVFPFSILLEAIEPSSERRQNALDGFLEKLRKDSDFLSETKKSEQNDAPKPAERIRRESRVDVPTETYGGEPGMDVSRASDPSRSYVISRPIFNLFGDLTTMTTAALEREQRENRLPYDDLTTGEAYRVLPDGVGQIASRFGPRDRPDLDEARTEDDIALHGDERSVPRFRSGRQGGVPQGEDISTQPGKSGAYNTLPKGTTALEPRIKPDLPVEPAADTSSR